MAVRPPLFDSCLLTDRVWVVHSLCLTGLFYSIQPSGDQPLFYTLNAVKARRKTPQKQFNHCHKCKYKVSKANESIKSYIMCCFCFFITVGPNFTLLPLRDRHGTVICVKLCYESSLKLFFFFLMHDS